MLATHVAIIGSTGLYCLRRLIGLLETLTGSAESARRLFLCWFAVQALAGTQLSWILRPYLGKPGLPVEFFRADALERSFIEEVLAWVVA